MTAGLPVPRHSTYSRRPPPMSTRPAKSPCAASATGEAARGVARATAHSRTARARAEDARRSCRGHMIDSLGCPVVPRPFRLATPVQSALPNAGVQAPFSHFFMKLVFAAPESGLPSWLTALVAQVSAMHFLMDAVLAAPASGLPSLPTALLSQVSCARAAPPANATTNAANIIFLSMVLSLSVVLE